MTDTPKSDPVARMYTLLDEVDAGRNDPGVDTEALALLDLVSPDKRPPATPDQSGTRSPWPQPPVLSSYGRELLDDEQAPWRTAKSPREVREQPIEYGTAGWLQLPKNDPRKLEAMFKAAEEWRELMDSPAARAVVAVHRDTEQRRTLIDWSSAVSSLVNDPAAFAAALDDYDRRYTDRRAPSLTEARRAYDYLYPADDDPDHQATKPQGRPPIRPITGTSKAHEEFTARHGCEYSGGAVDWATGHPVKGGTA